MAGSRDVGTCHSALRSHHRGVETRSLTRREPEPIDGRLRELYRAASPTEKLAAVARLNATLTAVKEAAVARQHPDWSPAQRRGWVQRWWLSARD